MRSRALTLSAVLCLSLAGFLLPAAEAQAPPAAQPAAPQPPPGAEPAAPSKPQVTLILDRGPQRAQIRLAFPAFRAVSPLSGDAARAEQELESTVRQDLALSGYFEIQGPAELAGAALSGDVQRDLEVYRARNNQVVLTGDVKSEEDKLVFDGRLFDLGSGQSILAKRYRGQLSVIRRMAHTFSDEVIHYLTGGNGIGLSTIAFTSDRTGHQEIFLMDYDGRNQRRVTGHRSTSMSPAWSPNGEAIAYTSFVNGPPGVYVADLGSGRKRPLVTSGSLNTTPSWAPDGEHLTFARSLDGNVEIFSCDSKGGNLRRLTNSPAIDTNPAWSPKGSTIAFTSSRSGNPQIYVMDAEGSNQRRLTFDGTYNDGAAWSPDGDRIAYTSRRDGTFQIAVTNAVTLETKVLTSGPGENESPSFSPDGRKIAFTSRRSGTKQIYVMDAADGGNVRQLTDAGNNDMSDWSRHSGEKER